MIESYRKLTFQLKLERNSIEVFPISICLWANLEMLFKDVNKVLVFISVT